MMGLHTGSTAAAGRTSWRATTKRSATGSLVVAAALALALPAAHGQTARGQTGQAAQPETGTAAAEQSAQQPLLEPPVLKRAADAVYPERALAERVQGRVVLELEIDASGSASVVGVSQSLAATEQGVALPKDSDYGFEQAAREAAGRLHFEPARENGVPVPVRIEYSFNFALPPLAAPPAASGSATAAPARSPEPPPPRAPVVNFAGELLERGTRSKLVGVLVSVTRKGSRPPEAYEATTDASGRFRFRDLAPGIWKLRLDAQGYYALDTEERVSAGERVDVRYYVERGSYNPFEVLVEAPRARKEVNRRSLSREEILRVPGTLGDPVLVVENLPGVARAFDGTGEIIVRGSAPEDTRIFVEGIELPLVYHFGGLKSVLPASMLESIDFYPGNFGVQYGRALGGIFDARLKRLEPDGVHGSLDISLLDTALFLEMPLGDKAAIALGARRSYIDFVLNAAIPDDAPIGLITAPRYYDYQVLAVYRPAPAHDLRFLFLGSDDRLELLFADAADVVPLAQSNGASFATRFNRAMLEYRYTPDRTFSNHLRVALGKDVIDVQGLGIFKLDIRPTTLQVRNTAAFTLSPAVRVNLGLDAIASVTDVFVLAPSPPSEGSGPQDFDPRTSRTASEDNDIGFSLAPFIEAELQVGRFRLVPGLRLDYFEAASEFSFDPRLLVRYDWDRFALKAGVAVVHQEPQPWEYSPEFGNPDLRLQAGAQYSVGVEARPVEYLRADFTLFYKSLYRLVGPTDAVRASNEQLVPLYFDNNRTGRVYGAETFIEHKFANNFRGWLSYTLMRAERLDAGSNDYRPFDFDQTHIFALVASYRLPRNWELGLRWRIVSGNPYTPVAYGVYVHERDEYVAVPGALNSARAPSFHQMDLRVDKTWVYDVWRLSAYLSVINAYNRKNPQGIVYNYDFSDSDVQGGLPIIPIIGVKGEW
ncbi:MAG: TonB family protein [Proteobacteria bacterium]|nr:TonB family protein [Pseudomonadota bacterium]